MKIAIVAMVIGVGGSGVASRGTIDKAKIILRQMGGRDVDDGNDTNGDDDADDDHEKNQRADVDEEEILELHLL